MTGPLAEAIGVTRSFGSFVALNDVSMTVGAGEVVGLLGANGAGKTTLIRLLLGLIAPTRGEVRLMGGVPDRQARSRLGYVPQGLGLYGDLTVAQNVQFVADAYGVAAAQIPADMLPYADRLVGDIPLGLQRRLAFGCALLHDPDLLVLDEPTSGVDPIAAAELWDTIHQQAEAGVAVLVTTHYMQEAQQCDRLLLISAGQLVAQGNESDIIGDTTAVEVVTDDWSAAFAALNTAGEAVTLAGRAVRVADADPDHIRRVLAAAGVSAGVASAPATIEERMTVLAKAQQTG